MTQFRFAYLAYFHLTLATYEIKHENNRYTSNQILRKNNCFTNISLQSTNPIKLSTIYFLGKESIQIYNNSIRLVKDLNPCSNRLAWISILRNCKDIVTVQLALIYFPNIQLNILTKTLNSFSKIVIMAIYFSNISKLKGLKTIYLNI